MRETPDITVHRSFRRALDLFNQDRFGWLDEATGHGADGGSAGAAAVLAATRHVAGGIRRGGLSAFRGLPTTQRPNGILIDRVRSHAVDHDVFTRRFWARLVGVPLDGVDVFALQMTRRWDDDHCVRWNDFGWLRSNRPRMIAQIIALPLVVAWLLFAYFNGHNTFALVILALLPFFVVANVVMINRARRRLSDPGTRRDSPTGKSLSPLLMQPPPQQRIPEQRWIGAADLPGSMGRMNASMPLGVLELSAAALTLRVRPDFLAAVFGVKPLVVTPAEVDAISLPVVGSDRALSGYGRAAHLPRTS
jgi:hypothetical protein